MKRIIAIGDIHGNAKRLEALLKILPLDSDTSLLFLGDYIDRGPNSKDVLDIVIGLRDMYNVIPLRGNHEQMLLNFVDNPDDVDAVTFYLGNGGAATIKSYNGEIPDDHLSFIRSLSTSYETDSNFFSHAGARPYIPLNEQEEEDLLWIRYSFIYSQYDFGKRVIFGHTTQSIPYVDEFKIGIDTKAYHSEGSLTALILPQYEFVQVAI